MIYRCVMGSESYGLTVAGSDKDIGIVSNKTYELASWRRKKVDVRVQPPQMFAELRCGGQPDIELSLRNGGYIGHPWTCQWFFPHKFCMDNDLTKWVAENREDMMKAILPSIYEKYSNFADGVRLVPNRYYRGEQKFIAYAIHFRNLLANYAEGMTFAEAHKAQGETRDFLLSVRKGEVPIKLVLEENAKARERAKAVAGFYAEPKADKSILDEFKYMVNREVELLRGNGSK